MVYARKAELLFNFRKHELAKGTSLTEVSTFLKDPNILRIMKYAAAFAFILLVHVTVSSNLSEMEAKKATDDVRRVFKETFRDVPEKLRNNLTSKPKELKKYIDQKNNEVDQKLKMLARSRVTMLSLVRIITDAFPSDVRVDVNDLQLGDRVFTMEGVSYDGDLKRVKATLDKNPAFNNVTLQEKTEANGVRFTFHGNIVGR
jgi:hypothetical protein